MARAGRRGGTRDTLAGSTLAAAPIVAVSAITGEGLDDLRAAIDTHARSRATAHARAARPRLPIDRVFTISGFGTVVTGTLIDGPLDLGQEVEIQPGGLRGRVRGLQSHRSKVERALPGSRTAVNLSGLAVEDLARGQVLDDSRLVDSDDACIDAQLQLVDSCANRYRAER